MLGKYDRQVLIGTGTFGHVLLVRSRDTGDQYALKQIQLSSMSEMEKLRALTEVKILARCKHVNIIRYKEAAIQLHSDTLSIVMEYADGGNLHTAIKRQKGVLFEENIILDWFVQMTCGLKYIHDHNILHRDLKTRNMFLTGQNVVKIGDFGIARVLEENKEWASTMIGTPYYLSPEICNNNPYSFKSDIWALGCVLYELATLKHPFEAPNFLELVHCITNGRYKELPKRCGHLIPSLVRELLHREAKKRPSVVRILSLPCLRNYLNNYAEDVQGMTGSDQVWRRRTSSTDIEVKLNVPSIQQRRFSATDMQEDANQIRNASAIRDGCRDSNNCGLAASFTTERRNSCIPVMSRIPLRKHEIPALHALRRSLEPKIMSFKEGPDGKWVETSCRRNENESCKRKTDADVGYHTATGDTPIGAKFNCKTHSASPITTGPSFYSFQRFEDSTESLAPSIALSQCHHELQCDRCLNAILWKTRIRVDNIQNMTNGNRLKKILKTAVGSHTFCKLYGSLSELYNSESEKFLKKLATDLSLDQRKLLPLFLQYHTLRNMSAAEEEEKF